MVSYVSTNNPAQRSWGPGTGSVQDLALKAIPKRGYQDASWRYDGDEIRISLDFNAGVEIGIDQGVIYSYI